MLPRSTSSPRWRMFPSIQRAAEHASVAVSRARIFTLNDQPATRATGSWGACLRIKRMASSRSRVTLIAGRAATKTPAIAAPQHSGIANDHGAVILFAANQTSNALFQGESGLRKLVLPERLPPVACKCSILARTKGSSGDANGNFSMITSRNASPFTSTPPQKFVVPNSTLLTVLTELLQQALPGCFALYVQAIRSGLPPFRANQRGSLR